MTGTRARRWYHPDGNRALTAVLAVMGVALATAACAGVAAAQAPAPEDAATEEAQAFPAIGQAAHYGDIDAVERQLRAGADVDAVSATGMTPLMLTFQPHIGPPSKINGPDPAAFRVSRARQARKLRIARMLLDRGANVARVSRHGMTALHYLVLAYGEERALFETLQVVMEKGADPNVANSNGLTPLMFAAWRNRLRLVKSLIAAGADPDATAKDGSTALSISREHGHEAVAALLERGKR